MDDKRATTCFFARCKIKINTKHQTDSHEAGKTSRVKSCWYIFWRKWIAVTSCNITVVVASPPHIPAINCLMCTNVICICASTRLNVMAINLTALLCSVLLPFYAFLCWWGWWCNHSQMQFPTRTKWIGYIVERVNCSVADLKWESG